MIEPLDVSPYAFGTFLRKKFRKEAVFPAN